MSLDASVHAEYTSCAVHGSRAAGSQVTIATPKTNKKLLFFSIEYSMERKINSIHCSPTIIGTIILVDYKQGGIGGIGGGFALPAISSI